MSDASATRVWTSDELEQRRWALRALAESIIDSTEHGYLRPWMCAGDPAEARVFLVGANAATEFPTALVDRTEYLDALVAGGPRLRGIYDVVRDGRPSPTRANIDGVVATLTRHGTGPVTETNVWALPTPSLRELQRRDPSLVESSGVVLPELVRILDPVALIIHGTAASEEAANILERHLRAAEPTDPVRRFDGQPKVFTLPSLSPPRANSWLQRSTSLLDALASEIASLVRAGRG